MLLSINCNKNQLINKNFNLLLSFLNWVIKNKNASLKNNKSQKFSKKSFFATRFHIYLKISICITWLCKRTTWAEEILRNKTGFSREMRKTLLIFDQNKMQQRNAMESLNFHQWRHVFFCSLIFLNITDSDSATCMHWIVNYNRSIE